MKQVISVQESTPTPIPTVTPIPQPVFHQKPLDDRVVWENIQNWRAEQSLPQYIEHQGLCKLADKRLPQLYKDYNHIIFSDEDYKLAGVKTISENIVTQIYYDSEPLNKWLSSPKHAAALKRKDFTHSCLRCGNGYCVQLFTY